MELFAAIDLRGGTAVRLTQGDFDRQQQYGDPLSLAASYADAGVPWIHVVDLNAARTGVPHERETIQRIVAGGVPVQCGGGVRTEAAVAALLESGVTRVVMGTAAVEDPELARHCARTWPGRVAVALDYALGADGVAEAMGHGWAEGSGRSLPELLAHWEGEPVGAVVATSIARDGMLEGPDLDGMRQLLETTALPVVASGGVGELTDLEALAALTAGGRRLAGVIVGKALVEGRFTLKEALAACVPSA
jgi:phosphoribosylformimino-5-aminoimidazole carboxamide ribotide isomerase